MTDSKRAKNPTGGATRRRIGMDDVLGEVRMESVVASENMRNAWAQVKRNRGAPGIDRRTIAATQAWLRIHYATVRESLLNGTYEPQPVRRAQIAKRSGGTRDLGIPTVLDRVIQQAIAQVLTPIFDVGFSASSFGFRPGRSAHGALRQMQSYVRRGYRIAVDMDVEKFFDRVNHDVLMARVARKVTDKRMLGVIGRFLRAGVWVEGEVQPSEMGTPQGGPLSPLLANILLDDLDKELERRGHLFARYADDLLIVVRSARAGERVMASVQRYLGRVLRLQVNAQKSRVGPIDACPFLGFHIVKGKLRWSARAFADFKHRIRKLTGRSWGVSMEARLRRLREYLQGWMGYFGITEYYRPIPELDSWLRRRVRMCYWKQWRKPRTRIGHLLAMGTSREHAIRTGLSRKGYWHLAKTLATQTGMTNEWLSTQGLASIRALWMRVHGYAD